jgi:feruloyl-CoA synthase
LTGLDCNHIGALLLLDLDAARGLAPEIDRADEAALAGHAALRTLFQERLDALAAASTGSSNLVARAIVLDRPPSPDANEITDKGSINQRAMMAARSSLVEDLYTDPPPAHVLVARGRS